ncbi:unnamed protein product [Didymodactylos carnosus]|uniref:Importin N-terminal domain-containing protein n=1 Tax=Didymodactylos carnosus TaxID=1234261 RepID=A0A8S2UY09_9BILA|nr:unnamed protein product [Didymodactylos carnosus]CAF4368120.1 unnamed protein product [Didymodactylos carnosus]
MSSEQMLQILENCVNEFYDSKTSHERKNYLHLQLNEFLNGVQTWKICLESLRSIKNPLLTYYLLQTFEQLIKYRWNTNEHISMDEQILIRDTLIYYLIDSFSSMVSYIRNKIMSLIVQIARKDCPRYWPNFFTTILHVSGADRTAQNQIIQKSIHK